MERTSSRRSTDGGRGSITRWEPWLVWREREPNVKAAAGPVYGRLCDPLPKRSDTAHRVAWRRVYGPIPVRMTVGDLCEVTLCQRPDHLELVLKPENTRRRYQRGYEQPADTP